MGWFGPKSEGSCCGGPKPWATAKLGSMSGDTQGSFGFQLGQVERQANTVRLGTVSGDTHGNFGPWSEGNGVWIKLKP